MKFTQGDACLFQRALTNRVALSKNHSIPSQIMIIGMSWVFPQVAAALPLYCQKASSMAWWAHLKRPCAVGSQPPTAPFPFQSTSSSPASAPGNLLYCCLLSKPCCCPRGPGVLQNHQPYREAAEATDPSDPSMSQWKCSWERTRQPATKDRISKRLWRLPWTPVTAPARSESQRDLHWTGGMG